MEPPNSACNEDWNPVTNGAIAQTAHKSLLMLHFHHPTGQPCSATHSYCRFACDVGIVGRRFVFPDVGANDFSRNDRAPPTPGRPSDLQRGPGHWQQGQASQSGLLHHWPLQWLSQPPPLAQTLTSTCTKPSKQSIKPAGILLACWLTPSVTASVCLQIMW